jgi:hypothetical protein
MLWQHMRTISHCCMVLAKIGSKLYMNNLVRNARFSIVRHRVGATTCYSSGGGLAVDMAGYNGCCFVAIGSTLLSASSSPYAKLEVQGSSASTGTLNTYSGYVSSTKPVPSSGNYNMLIADIAYPRDRFLRAKLTCATSSDLQWSGVLAIQYNPSVCVSSYLENSTTLGGSTLLHAPST